MNTTQFSTVTSVYTLGGLIGALAAGSSCNRYGRLLTMRMTTVSFVLGSILETLASNIGLLAFGRLVSGLGCGAAIVVVPIYIAEIAPPKEKGLFGAFTQISICMGILVTQLLGYFLSKGNLWRIILAVAGAIGLVQLAGLFLVPESPKWLAEHRSPHHARHILRKIRGHKADVDAEVKAWNIDATANDICQSLDLSIRLYANLPFSRRRVPVERPSRISSSSESRSRYSLNRSLGCPCPPSIPTRRYCRHSRHVHTTVHRD